MNKNITKIIKNFSSENPFATKAQRHEENKYTLSFPSPTEFNWVLGMPANFHAPLPAPLDLFLFNGVSRFVFGT